MSYKDEQYVPCLWREENHTTSKRIVLYGRQLYTECSMKLPFSVKIDTFLSQKSETEYKKEGIM